MYFGDDEGGSFLAPTATGGSKLHSLFGMDSPDASSNDSLKYTAPKQPKQKGEPKAKAGGAAPEIMVAVAAHAYKLVDGKYASQGKLGVAVLAVHADKDYKLLLYVTKQQQVTHAKVTPSFSFTVQENNYVMFYDDSRVTWSLLFDNNDVLIDFSKQIVLAKALSQPSPPLQVTSLDLVSGSGNGLEVNDSAEVSYTGWLVTNNKYGDVFDSNPSFRVKVGKGKVIKGWDDSLIGMKKGSKHILVIPPHLAYGAAAVGDKVPANSTLIFVIEIIRVKLAKGEGSTIPTDQSLESSVDGGQTTDDEATIKARTRSINEQMHNKPVKSDKAKLISRMAKMGQPMLPLGGAVIATEFSDEETEPESPQVLSPVETTPPSRPPVTKRPSRSSLTQSQQPSQAINQSTQQAIPQQQPQPYTQQKVYQPPQPAVYQPTMPSHVLQPPVNQPIIVDQHYPQYNTPIAEPVPSFIQNHPSMQRVALYQPPQTMNPLLNPQNPFPNMQAAAMSNGVIPNPLHASNLGNSSDNLTPMFVSETRQQNTEMRLSLSKMTDKLDRTLEKLDFIQSHSLTSSSAVSNTMATMEASILMHNIQRIVQENDRLKKELFDQNTYVESQNTKISQLLQQHQRSVEQGHNFLEQSSNTYKEAASQSQGRVLALEQEKVQLTGQLSTLTSQLSTAQLDVTSLKRSEAKLRQDLTISTEHGEKLSAESVQIKLKLSESEKKLTELTELLKDEKQTRKTTEVKIQGLLEDIDDLKSAKDATEKNLEERKKKFTEEKKRSTAEMDDTKQTHEKEIAELNEKIRLLRSNTDAAASMQIATLETELNDSWSAKLDKAMKQEKDRHQREITDVKNDLSEKVIRITELETKLSASKTTTNEHQQSITNLTSQIDQLSGWKQKYDDLRNQAGVMKQRYDVRIAEQQEKIESLETEVEELEQQGATEDSTTKVKSVMNSVFQSIKGQIDVNSKYTGATVMQSVLGTIKAETLKMIKGDSTSAAITAAAAPVEEESDESETESEDEIDNETENASEQPTEDDVADDVLDNGESEHVDKIVKSLDVTSDEVEEKMSAEHLVKSSDTFAENTDSIHIENRNGVECIDVSLDHDTQKSSQQHNKYTSNTDNILVGDPKFGEDTYPIIDEDSDPKVDEVSDPTDDKEDHKVDRADDPKVDLPIDEVRIFAGKTESENDENEQDLDDFTDKKENDIQIVDDTICDEDFDGGLDETSENKVSSPRANGVTEDTYTDGFIHMSSTNEINGSSEDTEDEMNEITNADKSDDKHNVKSIETKIDSATKTEMEVQENVTKNGIKDEKVIKEKSTADLNVEKLQHVPSLKSRSPPPLDDKNSSLFEDDDENFVDAIEETFGNQFKTQFLDESIKVENKKETSASKSATTLVSVDYESQDKPPPLFGDDDDDDLDWLS